MKKCLALLVVCGIFFSSTSDAAIVYELFIRVPGSPAFDGRDSRLDVAMRQVFQDAQVILRETVSDGSTSLLANNNINSFNLRITAVGGDGNFEGLTTDTTGGFPGGSNSSSQMNFVALGAFFGQPGRISEDIGNGMREAVLGTVDLVAPSSGATTFQLADATAADGDFTVFNTAGGLESRSSATVGGGFFGRGLTLGVTAIPEPGIAGLSLLSIGMLMRRRSRRRG